MGLVFPAHKFEFQVKFIYSEKATHFCKISTVDLSYVVTVKSTMEISQMGQRHKMTWGKVWDVLMKSWILSPENGPQ